LWVRPLEKPRSRLGPGGKRRYRRLGCVARFIVLGRV